MNHGIFIAIFLQQGQPPMAMPDFGSAWVLGASGHSLKLLAVAGFPHMPPDAC